jgi:hypothetical protein
VTPRSSKRKENSILDKEMETKKNGGDGGLCACTPVACGADGGTGCVVSWQSRLLGVVGVS